MSVTITRDKGGRTHYAVSVDAKLGSDGNGNQVINGTGHISSWSENPEQAGRFPAPVAKHVLDRHVGRLNAGRLIARDENGRVLGEVEGPEAAPPTGAKRPAPAGETDARGELDELRKQLEQVNEWGEGEERRKKAAEEALAESRRKVAELEAEAKKLRKEAEDAQTEVKKLRKDLEDAQKAKATEKPNAGGK